MDGLEAVAHVGQRPRHDDAHRVVEVARRASRPRCGWLGRRPGRRSRSAPPAVSGRSAMVGRLGGRRVEGSGSAAEAGRGRGGDGRGRRARPAGGCRRARSRSSCGDGRASFARLSRMTQARWPSSVAAARSVSRAERRHGRGEVDVGERAVGPRERLLDVGSASPMSWPRSGRRVLGDVRLAAAAPVDVGHRRDRRADEAALPARRREDELLELGPAIGLRERCRVPYGWARASTVTQSRGLARRAAEQLPACVPARRERPLEDAEREPARLDDAARRKSRPRGSRSGDRPLASRRRLEPAQERRRGAASGRRGSAPTPARRRAGPPGTSGRRARRSAVVHGSRRTRPGRGCARPTPRPSASASCRRSATNAVGALGDRAGRLGRLRRVRPSGSCRRPLATSPGVGAVGHDAELVARLELVLARVRRRDVQGLGRREDGAVRIGRACPRP